jgi:membrane protein involved in colicin uptake
VPVWVPSMQRMQRAAQPDPSGAHLLKAPSAVEQAKQQATPPLSARVPAVVALTDAEAKRKADEAEQQRLAAAKAEEERKAKAAAEAEAKRKVAEAEQQRLAAAKAEEERRKLTESEARSRYNALASQSSTAFNSGDYDRAIATATEAIRLPQLR